MNTFISHCENDTKNFAKKLASKLSCGDIVILSGELGSGKTKFTEGLLEYFNIANQISSPTFTIVNEYQKDNLFIYHFDVYRLHSIDEFYEIGGPDYFNNGICIVEWGEIIEQILPNDYIKISFEKDNTNDNLRILNIETFGNRFKNILGELL